MATLGKPIFRDYIQYGCYILLSVSNCIRSVFFNINFNLGEKKMVWWSQMHHQMLPQNLFRHSVCVNYRPYLFLFHIQFTCLHLICCNKLSTLPNSSGLKAIFCHQLSSLFLWKCINHECLCSWQSIIPMSCL